MHKLLTIIVCGKSCSITVGAAKPLHERIIVTVFDASFRAVNKTVLMLLLVFAPDCVFGKGDSFIKGVLGPILFLDCAAD